MSRSTADTWNNCCRVKLPLSAIGTELLWRSCASCFGVCSCENRNPIRISLCWGEKYAPLLQLLCFIWKMEKKIKRCSNSNHYFLRKLIFKTLKYVTIFIFTSLYVSLSEVSIVRSWSLPFNLFFKSNQELNSFDMDFVFNLLYSLAGFYTVFIWMHARLNSNDIFLLTTSGHFVGTSICGKVIKEQILPHEPSKQLQVNIPSNELPELS